MKKLLTLFVCFALTCSCLALFAFGCGNSEPVEVKGKTFVYSKVEIVSGTASDEDKEETERQWNGYSWVFTEEQDGDDFILNAVKNGKVQQGFFYLQEGAQISLDDTLGDIVLTFTAESDCIYIEDRHENGFTARWYFDLQK